MSNVAREDPGATGTYVDRLRQVANDKPYTGPVSGVDQATSLVETKISSGPKRSFSAK